MSESDRDPVGPADSEMLPASPAPNQVFIISSDPLRAFIAALNPALRAKEEFTIIVDRRRADSENAARPVIERRHRPSVDAKVKTDGFAIVPLSTTDAPPWIERLVDRQSDDDDVEADERELRRILEFNRRQRKARFGPLVRTFAIVGAFSALVVLFVQMPAGKALVNRAPEPPIEAQARSVVDTPAPPGPSRLSTGRISRPRDAVRTPTEVSSQPPGPQSIAALEALESRVTSDVNTAGVEAKRQFDELKSKTMKSLDEMRRMWNNARAGVSDQAANSERREAVAKLRR